MDHTSLLTGSRWELLRMLASKPQSTSQLAEQLGTSQANVSQQLKQLELAGFIQRRRAVSGRVHYLYEIPKDAILLTYIGPRTALKKSLRADEMQRFLAGLILHEHGTALLTFVLGRPDLVNRMRAIGVLDRKDPELFVLADSVEDIRREHANITLMTIEGEEKIALWSHTATEVREGLERNEPYFENVLEEVDLLYDPTGVLLELKRSTERQG